jgi:hypothetical protein
MPYAIQFHCPETGAIVDLGIHAETLDDVRFRTLFLKDCPSCQLDHELSKEDLFIDREPPV